MVNKIDPKVWLTITQVADGEAGAYLCQANGKQLSREAVWQRVIRSLLQDSGQSVSRHPLGYPELHLNDGSVGVVQVSKKLYLIHPSAVVNSEKWRTGQYADSYPNRGPAKGMGLVKVGDKGKRIKEWLHE